MIKKFPRVYYVCPCTDITASPRIPGNIDNSNEDELEEQQPFNPYSPRANYALYPIEHLLFCTECHEIRCPRCYYEEVLSYYCPRCLNETTRASVKSESNRCSQSCHDCPVCFAPLVVNRYQESPQASSNTSESFILSCLSCSWTTLELGISFTKSVNISGQLARMLNGGQSIEPLSESKHLEVLKQPQEARTSHSPYKTTTQFDDLADFYSSQLDISNPQRDSARYVARVSSTLGTGYLRRQASKPQSSMLESSTATEGLRIHEPADDVSIIAKMKQLGWSGTTNAAQRAAQPDSPLLLSAARPMATKLLTNRAKRCRTCRRQLVRPENARSSTRFLIRLVAAKHVPRLTLQFLQQRQQSRTTTASPAISPLTPGVPCHLLATFINPLFEAVKVTLATPQTTPGPIASRVTILCPQFDMGPNPDTFDSVSSQSTGRAGRLGKPDVPASTTQQPEAGKVWEKGRNWTTVVVEVVPGAILSLGNKEGEEDVAVLKIPVFVRLEYSTDGPVGKEVVGTGEGNVAVAEGKVAREIAYWCVFDVGRIGAVA